MADANQFYVVYHKPDGTTNRVPVHSSSYSVAALPADYASSTASVRCQLYTDTSYSVEATSEYGQSSKFTIYRVYGSWALGSATGTTRFTANQAISLSAYADEDNEVHLYPYVSSKYATGYFNTGPWTYAAVTLTGNCNYSGGTNTSITLSSQIRQQFLAKSWTHFQGMSLSGGGITPGTTQTIQLAGVSYTEGNTIYIKGVFKERTAWELYGSGTYADLPKPTAPSDSTSTYTVSLTTSSGVLHATESLSVTKTTKYTFDHWSTTATDSGAVSESTKPTSSTTLYAIWKTTTTTSGTLPQWTSSSTMKYGSSAYDTFTLDCYSLPSDTTPVFTKTVEKYEFKPAKHTGWKSGSTTYAIGSTVTLSSGATYTAVWEPNASGTSTYEIYDNVVTLPTPTRTSYSFLGWSTTDGGNAVFCSNVVGGNGLLSSPICPEFWIYADSMGTLDGTYKGDVFIGYDYLDNNQGITVPVLYKTDESEYNANNSAFLDPDYVEPFYYVGTEYYNGTRYDKWRKIASEGNLSWTSSNSIYVYTQPIVTAGSDFLINDEHMIISDVIMYAVWKANGTVEIYNSTTKQFDKYQPVVYNSSTGVWDKYVPKIYNGSSWDDVYV